MYRFFDPPIHSIAFSVDDLGLVPIYDMIEGDGVKKIKLKVVIR